MASQLCALQLCRVDRSDLGNIAQGKHKFQNPRLIRYRKKNVSSLKYFAFNPKYTWRLKFCLLVLLSWILAFIYKYLMLMFYIIFMCLPSVQSFWKVCEHSVCAWARRRVSQVITYAKKSSCIGMMLALAPSFLLQQMRESSRWIWS